MKDGDIVKVIEKPECGDSVCDIVGKLVEIYSIRDDHVFIRKNSKTSIKCDQCALKFRRVVEVFSVL